jgi:hypothetical protein
MKDREEVKQLPAATAELRTLVDANNGPIPGWEKVVHFQDDIGNTIIYPWEILKKSVLEWIKVEESEEGWICDGCGENYSCKESPTIIKTGTLSGVAMCKECYFDNHKEEVVNEMENAKRKSTTG